MSKVAGIIGYKNSGKTTLTRALARELTTRGYEVAMIKHMSHHVDLAGKDTAVLAEVMDQVGFISPLGSGIFWRKTLTLERMIPYLEADFILVEGFKMEETLPRIACLRGRLDDRDLLGDLTICAVGPPDRVAGAGVLLLSRDDVGQIADLVEQNALRFPDPDCAEGGHK